MKKNSEVRINTSATLSNHQSRIQTGAGLADHQIFNLVGVQKRGLFRRDARKRSVSDAGASDSLTLRYPPVVQNSDS